MKHLRVITALLGIIATVVVGFVLYQLSSVLVPFVIAVFLAYIFRPIVLFLERRKVPNVLSIVLVVAIVAGVMVGLYGIVSASATAFMKQLPTYQAKFEGLAASSSSAFNNIVSWLQLDPNTINWRDTLPVSSITGFVSTGLSSLLSLMGNLLLVLLFMLFILAGSGDFLPKVRRAFNNSYAETIATIIANIDSDVRRYLMTKAAISLASGVVTWLILTIIGVDFALLWGFLSFALNFIPNVGSFVSFIFPTLISVLQFDTLTKPILVLVLLLVSDNIMGNVVEPKIMGASLNLSPVVVLVSLIFWGWLWGIPGMILAVPLTSMIKIVFANIPELKPMAVLMSGGEAAKASPS